VRISGSINDVGGGSSVEVFAGTLEIGGICSCYVTDISIFHGKLGGTGNVNWSFHEVDAGGNAVSGGKSGHNSATPDSGTTVSMTPS
jgi:hypothetical protein